MTSLRLPELLRQQSFNVPAADTENTASVIAELTQVHGLVRKLAAHLDSPHIDLCRTLAREIIFSIEKAIHTAKSTAENPLTDVGSQLAEIPNKAFDAEQSRTKHRKMLPQWSSHVSMSSGTAQGVPDDGRTWRKYGQKGILGAKYPRAYYRCTHRKTQGCPATKQVQRSDENPAVFDIIYRGTHICSNPTQQTTAAVMRSHRQQNIWAQKTEGTNSVCQYPSSSFSLPSSFMSSSTLGLKSHHGFAEIISAANDDTDFMDLGIMFEVGDMVGDLPYDASAFFI